MSKYVKDLVSKHYAQRLEGVDDALVVNVIGLDANQSVVLRKELREKNIQLLVVKNSLVKRASEGTPLAPVFEGAEGSLAIMWGSEDAISLAKEATKLQNDKDYEAFETRGGMMDGEVLSADRVREISKWPSREEQLSLLVGQILGPGANLCSQLVGPGRSLASQVKQVEEKSQE
jgi:ribosomal protein L10